MATLLAATYYPSKPSAAVDHAVTLSVGPAAGQAQRLWRRAALHADRHRGAVRCGTSRPPSGCSYCLHSRAGLRVGVCSKGLAFCQPGLGCNSLQTHQTHPVLQCQAAQSGARRRCTTSRWAALNHLSHEDSRGPANIAGTTCLPWCLAMIAQQKLLAECSATVVASCFLIVPAVLTLSANKAEMASFAHVLQGAGLAAGALGAGAAGGMAAGHTGDHGTTGFQVCNSTCCIPNTTSAAHSGTLATNTQTLEQEPVIR